MKEDLLFLQGRRVWAAVTPVLLLKEPEKEGSVGRRSRGENCGSGLAVRLKCLDSGGLISAGFFTDRLADCR